MTLTEGILIAVDDSPAARRALAYVGKMLDGRTDCRIHLCHLLPLLPPELLEFRGAEDPEEEERLDAAQKAAQMRWIRDAEKAAEPMLETSCQLLIDAGLPPHIIRTECCEGNVHKYWVTELRAAAHRNHCHTIVVGRESLSRFRELGHRHVGDQLVREGSGFTVWVVE